MVCGWNKSVDSNLGTLQCPAEGGHELLDHHPFAWKTEPPHLAVSGPKKFIFVLFFLAKKLPQGPYHTKNTTVILIRYGGSKTLRRQ